MKNKLKAVIVDDERLARNVLKSALAEFQQITVAGEANNVSSAVSVIKETKPDIVFLDIQMPGESGFDLLEKIDVSFKVIFVTAHDKYAIRAFEVNALDYILKPIKKSRLKNSIDRLSGQTKQSAKKIQTDYNDKLLLNVEGRVKLIDVKNIAVICADKDYSRVFTTDGKELRLLKSMTDWMNKLPPANFERVHRSTIINLELIEKIEKLENNNHKITIAGLNKPVLMSRRYASFLKERFKF